MRVSRSTRALSRSQDGVPSSKTSATTVDRRWGSPAAVRQVAASQPVSCLPVASAMVPPSSVVEACQNLVADVDIGVHVLNIVTVFERLDEAEDLACTVDVHRHLNARHET